VADHELLREPLRCQYHLIPCPVGQLGPGVFCNVTFFVLIAFPVPIACHVAALPCRRSGHSPRLAHTFLDLPKIHTRHTSPRARLHALWIYHCSGRYRPCCFSLPAKRVAIGGDVGEAFLYCFRYDPAWRSLEPERQQLGSGECGTCAFRLLVRRLVAMSRPGPR
jgi:hypothetical protein